MLKNSQGLWYCLSECSVLRACCLSEILGLVQVGMRVQVRLSKMIWSIRLERSVSVRSILFERLMYIPMCRVSFSILVTILFLFHEILVSDSVPSLVLCFGNRCHWRMNAPRTISIPCSPDTRIASTNIESLVRVWFSWVSDVCFAVKCERYWGLSCCFQVHLHLRCLCLPPRSRHSAFAMSKQFFKEWKSEVFKTLCTGHTLSFVCCWESTQSIDHTRKRRWSPKGINWNFLLEDHVDYRTFESLRPSLDFVE